MEMTKKLYSAVISNIWLRAAAAVSLLWFIIGTVFYFGALGKCYHESETYCGLPSFIEWWAILSSKIGVPIFTTEIPKFGTVPGWSPLDYVNAPFDAHFSFVGYVFYITSPIVFAWLLFAAIVWVLNPNVFKHNNL